MTGDRSDPVEVFRHALYVLLCDADLEMHLCLAGGSSKGPSKPYFKISKLKDKAARLRMSFLMDDSYVSFPDKECSTVYELVAWFERMPAGSVSIATLNKIVDYKDPHMTFSNECVIPLWQYPVSKIGI